MDPLAELRLLIARHVRPGAPATALDGVRLLTSSRPTAPISSICEPALAVVAQGAKRTIAGDKVFDYAAGQYLVAAVELPISGHVVEASPEEPYLALTFALQPAAIAPLLLDLPAAARGPAEPAALAVSDGGAEIVEPLVRLLRLLDRPSDIGVLAPMLEREILWWLLNGPQGATVRQIGLADCRLARISGAIRWIRTHYAEPLRIEELARIAAMSPSSLHRNFRQVTALSPLQYQKRIRLQEARALLVARTDDVASIGFEVGYQGPSQFSREYSRLYGVAPGRDSVRLRADPTPRELA